MNLRTIRAYVDYYLGNAKYLFIHIPKNAGVSIRKAPQLQGRLVAAEPLFHKSRDYTRRLTRCMRDHDEHHGYHHARLIDIAASVRQHLQPVAVIRNPWARVVSRYRFALHAIENGKLAQDYVPGSFEEFLEERHVYGHREFYWHRAIRGWYPQTDYVVDENGNIAAHVLRHAHLHSDCIQYFQLQDAPARRNVTGALSKPYTEYYTSKTIQIVGDWYQKDIETFGFDFHGAATRNVYYADQAGAANRTAA